MVLQAILVVIVLGPFFALVIGGGLWLDNRLFGPPRPSRIRRAVSRAAYQVDEILRQAHEQMNRLPRPGRWTDW